MKMSRLVTIRSSRYGLDIELDSEAEFTALLAELAEKFRASSRFFGNAQMALGFAGRELSRAEEDEILEVINRNTQIEILCIIEHREKNELVYKSIIDRTLTDIRRWRGDFYRGPLGGKQILESESSVVILGDVEPGAAVRAGGNVAVFGTVYGSVQAGIPADRDAFVVALAMQPKQLCIGGVEAKRQIICQESLSIRGPKIAVVDGNRIYLDPLVE